MLPEHVAEITGPYGPVHITEKVVQRLWASGAFLRTPLRTASGKTLRLESTGRANMQEGPDFLEAEWTLDGAPAGGDVEIHFYKEDWRAHGHEYDANFRDVALHAVVFPPPRDAAPVKTASGRVPETLVLLPHLPSDLENVATEDALLRAEKRPEERSPFTVLAAFAPEIRATRLKIAAEKRWSSKIGYIRRRLENDPPATVAHRLVLETLGLRRNRAPMAELAARHTPEDFATLSPETFFEAMNRRWKLAGVRPANHPLTRLRAYARLASGRPDWPELFRKKCAALPPIDDTDDAAIFRRKLALGALRKNIGDDILAGAVSGSRLDTLVVDALLPWLAACDDRQNLFPLWRHWTMGDAPDRTATTLRTLGLAGPGRPVTNGLFQGLIGVACGL